MSDVEDATEVHTDMFKKARLSPNNMYYTPDYATQYVYEYVKSFPRVWEPCCGQNHITRFLETRGHTVIATDLSMGAEYDVLTYAPDPSSYDIIITNPPFQGKRKFFERLYSLNKPFAILVPTGLTFDSKMIRACLKADPTWGVIMPPRTINYIPSAHEDAVTLTRPPKGSRSWFHSSWFCHAVPDAKGVIVL